MYCLCSFDVLYLRHSPILQPTALYGRRKLGDARRKPTTVRKYRCPERKSAQGGFELTAAREFEASSFVHAACGQHMRRTVHPQPPDSVWITSKFNAGRCRLKEIFLRRRKITINEKKEENICLSINKNK